MGSKPDQAGSPAEDADGDGAAACTLGGTGTTDASEPDPTLSDGDDGTQSDPDRAVGDRADGA